MPSCRTRQTHTNRYLNHDLRQAAQSRIHVYISSLRGLYPRYYQVGKQGDSHQTSFQGISPSKMRSRSGLQPCTAPVVNSEEKVEQYMGITPTSERAAACALRDACRSEGSMMGLVQQRMMNFDLLFTRCILLHLQLCLSIHGLAPFKTSMPSHSLASSSMQLP